VSLLRIARELKVLGDSDSLDRLARSTVLAAAIGNLDMHAKNLSLLHHRDGSVTLAPAYDVVPQAHLPNDGELALAVHGVSRHAAVTRRDLVAEIAAWGVPAADEIVDASLAAVLETVATEVQDPRADARLRADIARFARNLQGDRAAGEG
jgi:serine/threonine-protein kinase HipA